MKMKLARSRRFRLCTACHQLILPGELYADQRWAPWECEDSDGSWWSQPACRWCSEGYWKHDDGDGWSDDWAQAWVDEQPGRWLEGFDCFEPRPVREEFTEPLEIAQKQARAFMAFLRRFAKRAKAAVVRRVGMQLLEIGFQCPPDPQSPGGPLAQWMDTWEPRRGLLHRGPAAVRLAVHADS